MTISIVAGATLICKKKQQLKLRITWGTNKKIFFCIPVQGSSVPLVDIPNDNLGELKITFDGEEVQEDDLFSTTGIARVPVSVISGETHIFELVDFMTGPKAGTARIAITDSTSTELDSLTINLIDAQFPEITSFAATPVCAPEGTPLTLSWATSPDTDNATLFNLQPSEDGLPTRTSQGWELKTRMAGSMPRVYTLSVRGHSAQSREAIVYPYNTAHPRSYEFQGDILGLFPSPDGRKLYALATENGKEAILWQTTNGFDPRQWQPVSTTERIPVAAARRPGAILGDKLWLVGGDRCDLQSTGRKAGFYDLTRASWREDEAHSFPEGMGCRMGHSALAFDNKLWVIGGWRQAEAFGDVWTYSESHSVWTRLHQQQEFPPRCLFAATATSSAVWVAGGWREPVDGSHRDLWIYTNGAWTKTIDDIPDFADEVYDAATMFTLGPKDTPCLLTTVKVGKSIKTIHLHQIVKSGNILSMNKASLFGGVEILGSGDDSSLFSCNFNDVAFLWRLDNANIRGGYSRITYLPIIYHK